MKFLVFNVAVVLALGFLFIVKPADVRSTSDNLSKIVRDIKNRVSIDYWVKQTTSDKSATANFEKKKPAGTQTDKVSKSLRADNGKVSPTLKGKGHKIAAVNSRAEKQTGPESVNRGNPGNTVLETFVKQKPTGTQIDDLLQPVQKDNGKVSPTLKEKGQKIAAVSSSADKQAGSERINLALIKSKQTINSKNGKINAERRKSDPYMEKVARKNNMEVRNILAEKPLPPSNPVTAEANGHKTNIEVRNILAEKPLPPSNPVTSEGNGFMSHSDRRRELMALADDMELAHAQSLGNQ
ncbi:MAG: hypothetical protein VYA17_10255 [Pseudomonadota bacterium]|nr:hypothetical protein [Pseudomonadota bacterium]